LLKNHGKSGFPFSVDVAEMRRGFSGHATVQSKRIQLDYVQRSGNSTAQEF
jgi:hypothetical protein